MVSTDLEGTELPFGEFSIKDWKAFLWADATRDEADEFRYDDDARESGAPGQLVPHTMCQHIVFEATGGIDETMSRLTEDWTSGAALGGLRAEFHAPLPTGEPLSVEGHISSVEREEGSSGPLTIVTHVYEVRTRDDEHVFDLEADMVLLEGLS